MCQMAAKSVQPFSGSDQRERTAHIRTFRASTCYSTDGVLVVTFDIGAALLGDVDVCFNTSKLVLETFS